MTSEHSVSINNWFKSTLIAKRFSMFSTMQQFFEVWRFYFRVCSKVDVNVEGDVNLALGEISDEPSLSKVSTEVSFNDDVMKKILM